MFYRWIFLLLLASCKLLLLASCQVKSPHQTSVPKDPCSQFEGKAMSAPYHIFIGKQIQDKERKIVEETIQKTFLEIDSLFNPSNPNSEISRLNAAPADALIPLSVPLQDLLSLCGQLVNLSGGRFDPTIEPLGRVWKESLDQQKMPSSEELQQACDASGWRHIDIKNGIFRKNHSNTRLDLGGILKGQCIDWLAERLQKLGFSDFFIEWGGEMRALGKHPLIGDWVVQINPQLTSRGQPIAPVPLRNSAIAMSGDYERKGWTLPEDRSSDGKPHRYFHIIDPIAGQPLETTGYSIASAIVLAPTCVLADALATAAMLFPTHKEAEKWAQEVVDHYSDVSFWILSYGKNK